MEIRGKIVRILSAQSGVSKTSGNAWQAQEYLLETVEARPRQICFEVFGEDKIREMNIQQGEDLTVSIEVESREYQGRWFTKVRAWKVDRSGALTPPVIVGASASTQPPVMNPLPMDSTDVLPF